MAVIEAITTTYLEADTSSVTFSSIPSTYKHLQVRATIRATDSGSGGYSGNLKCKLNGQGGAIYSNELMLSGDYNFQGASGAVTAWANANDNYMNLAYGPTARTLAIVYGSVIIDIFDYANTNKNTTVSVFGGVGMGDKDGNGHSVCVSSFVMDYTSAINAIYLYGHNSFVRGSSFTLYGIED